MEGEKITAINLNLIKKYFKNELVYYDQSAQSITGTLVFDKTYNNIWHSGAFEIKIVLPDTLKNETFIVYETGEKVIASYPHRYSDGSLCLATTAELILSIDDHHPVVDLIEKFIIPYFFSYIHWRKYGVFPFGERSHGLIGSLEYYCELCNCTLKNVKNCLLFCVDGNYRGHHRCPCGSGKKLRHCHGSLFQKIMNDTRIKNNIVCILQEIEEIIRGREINERKR